jgi:FkbM family methyltransferase
MNEPSPSLWQRTLVYSLWNDFSVWRKFKFELPRLKEVVLEGIRLDVSTLSSIMKNNLLLGRYEVQERTLASKYLTSADSVLEFGGAIGFIGLFCQSRIGISRYATVEANPNTAAILQRNYSLNGRTPVLFNVAVAAADGKVQLNIGAEFWENSLVERNDSSKTVEVPAMSLQSLIGKLSYIPTTLIIDIEGAEQFIDFRQLPDGVKKVLIELHPGMIGYPATYRIIGLLMSLGFEVVEETGGTYLFKRS